MLYTRDNHARGMSQTGLVKGREGRGETHSAPPLRRAAMARCVLQCSIICCRARSTSSRINEFDSPALCRIVRTMTSRSWNTTTTTLKEIVQNWRVMTSVPVPWLCVHVTQTSQRQWWWRDATLVIEGSLLPPTRQGQSGAWQPEAPWWRQGGRGRVVECCWGLNTWCPTVHLRGSAALRRERAVATPWTVSGLPVLPVRLLTWAIAPRL